MIDFLGVFLLAGIVILSSRFQECGISREERIKGQKYWEP
jgi:hypothetical protein